MWFGEERDVDIDVKARNSRLASLTNHGSE